MSVKKCDDLIRTLNEYTGKGIFHTRKYGNFSAIKEVFTFKKYSLAEKFNFFGALFSEASTSIVLEELLPIKLAEQVKKLEVPMYIFNGKEDLMTVANQAELFYNLVDAPKKRYYLYENSAHFPMFDEPQRFENDLKEILLETGGIMLNINTMKDRNVLHFFIS